MKQRRCVTLSPSRLNESKTRTEQASAEAGHVVTGCGILTSDCLTHCCVHIDVLLTLIKTIWFEYQDVAVLWSSG
jgi:hypothetical protein